MNLQTFFDNFDLLAEAPNGVKKLRELILQLAVQGRLAPQDPDDEPTAMQLDKARDAINVLTEENGLSEHEMDPEEVPYTLPIGWEWIRLGGGSKVYRRKPTSKEQVHL